MKRSLLSLLLVAALIPSAADADCIYRCWQDSFGDLSRCEEMMGPDADMLANMATCQPTRWCTPGGSSDPNVGCYSSCEGTRCYWT